MSKMQCNCYFENVSYSGHQDSFLLALIVMPILVLSFLKTAFARHACMTGIGECKNAETTGVWQTSSMKNVKKVDEWKEAVVFTNQPLMTQQTGMSGTSLMVKLTLDYSADDGYSIFILPHSIIHAEKIQFNSIQIYSTLSFIKQ